MKSPTIQLYGRFDGYFSHSQVSRGILVGLRAHGIRPLIWNVAGGHQASVYEDLPADTEVGLEAEAPIGIYIGGYPPLGVSWLQRHPVTAALYVCESSALPNSWSGMARAHRLVAVPSHWTADAYKALGVKRIVVAPHGLHSGYSAGPVPAPEAKPWRFLHIAGAASFIERKGTPQLLEAWARWREALRVGGPPLPTLTLRLAAPLEGSLPEGVTVEVGDAIPPRQLAARIATHHAVIQPSRAEAFGLIPLEARALGRPVLLTSCTGHAEHFEPWDAMINHRAEAPIAVQGIPNGRAPTVTVPDIVKALDLFWRQREARAVAAMENAKAYYEKWGWPTVTKAFAKAVEKLKAAP